MPSSFLQYNGKGIWIRDTTYALAMNLVHTTIAENEPSPEWSADLKEKIRLISLDHYYSHKTLPLDLYLTDDERRRYLIDILKKTVSRLHEGDDYISTDALHEMWREAVSDLEFTQPVRKKIFIKLLEHVVQLIRGDLPYTVKDATEGLWSGA